MASSTISFVRAQRSTLRRIYIIASGWFFILLAIVGWILPVLPGWLFLAIGLIILSTEYAWAHHLVERTKQRFPRFGAVLDSARSKVDRWF
jgi:uncharacterized membrane protein YbaN (DUF454 family)